MKKIFILILAILLPLSAFEMSADEKEARKIPLRVSFENGVTRSLDCAIESYYLGMFSAIQTTVTCDLGTIELIVTNLSSGETWTDVFDSSVTPHLFLISGAPGLYEITYLTSVGDLYEGTFTIE